MITMKLFLILLATALTPDIVYSFQAIGLQQKRNFISSPWKSKVRLTDFSNFSSENHHQHVAFRMSNHPKNGDDSMMLNGSSELYSKQKRQYIRALYSSLINKNRFARWGIFCATLMKSCRRHVKKAMIAAIFMITCFSSTMALAGTSGGRMGGGSFKSRPSMSRPNNHHHHMRSTPSMPHRRLHVAPTTVVIPRVVDYGSPRVVINTFSGAPYRSVSSAGIQAVRNTLFLAGAGALVVYGVTKNAYRQSEDGTGASGATVASLTVALDIPNRNDPDSILHKLRRLAETSNTSTKKGLQDLVTAVTIELVRQESSITSATAKANHYKILGQAEREFNMLSVKGRTKVDRLTVNKYGMEDRPDRRKAAGSDAVFGSPTKAIVTITVGLEGKFVDKSGLKINNRNELIDLLSRIGSDVQMEDSLLSAEVLWSPEDENDILTQDDIYYSYPDLLPM